MNKQAQLGIGGFVLLFIGIIVAIALLPAIADNVSTLSDTVTATNVTYTAPAANGTIDLGTAQELITLIHVTNHTDGTVVGAGNYTIAEGISATTGKKVVQYTSGVDANYVGDGVNVSMTYGAEGYADNSGARGMSKVILIFAALGLLGFVVYYAVGKSDFFK